MLYEVITYFLSLRKENLEKAEEMSHELILAEPENDTYLDTYGWVLFVREKYEEAEKVLEKAAKNTKSGTVLEHYGDVLFKVGKEEKAMEYWKKAKETGDEVTEVLDQKIDQKKYIEE